MKKTVTYEFTDKDKELLKTPLPDNPCTNCGMGTACCGCSRGYEYNEKAEPYKQAGIYDIAVSLKEIDTLKQQIKQCLDKIAVINGKLPDFCKIGIPEIQY